jgi:hypothetical protein
MTVSIPLRTNPIPYVFMPQLVRQLPWLIVIALVASGCSTFGLADANLETVSSDIGSEPTRRSPANEPASVSADSDPATAGDTDQDAAPITVQATDLADRVAKTASATDDDGEATSYRTVNSKAAANRDRTRAVATDASAESSDDQAETFDQLMAEARRRGALSAAEESSFRRDLADVPAHLRPQMAAMLLAMRSRQGNTPTESAASDPVAIGIPPDVAANPAKIQHPRTALATARGSQIPSTTAADLADENPLRALVGIEAARQSKLPNSVPGVANPNAANSASNVPGEIGDAQSAAPNGLAWPKSFAAPTAQPGQGENAQANRRVPHEATSEEWQVMLGATIRALESKVAASPDDQETPRRQALLRLLYLAANRLDDTAKAMPADANEQQFWIDWLYGTSVYLDDAATPNDGQRAAIAAERMRDAVQRLGEQANLIVNNMAFCRRVTSFGVYEPFTAKPGTTEPNYEFTANQEVLLYAEVRNYTSVPTAKGHHTLLRPSYQIFDVQGRRLGAVVELDESHDYCQRPRTDFFVCYHIYLPTRIDPGAYKLKLTIEDVHGGKVQENSIDFTIKRG